MKISVITVCYNAEKTIADTIRSVFAQRCPVPVEYLIVDGASKDNTLAVINQTIEQSSNQTIEQSNDQTIEQSNDQTIEQSNNRTIKQSNNQTIEQSNNRTIKQSNIPSISLISEPDQGLYDAINKGIARSTGDIIGILNADDRFEDESVLADIAKAFEDDPTLDCVYGDIRFVRGESNETTRYYSSRRWRRWMHNWGFMPAHPTMYVRRSVFDRFGAYKLGYEISADFEWMTRILCRNKIKARYLPRCMVTMRLGGKSTAGLKAMLKLNRENCKANRENGYFSILPMMLPKYAFKIWGYVFRR